ncbi:hypothetical protein MTO96_036021 [Rhipicephalus appendiculatus]
MCLCPCETPPHNVYRRGAYATVETLKLGDRDLPISEYVAPLENSVRGVITVLMMDALWKKFGFRKARADTVNGKIEDLDTWIEALKQDVKGTTAEV